MSHVRLLILHAAVVLITRLPATSQDLIAGHDRKAQLAGYGIDVILPPDVRRHTLHFPREQKVPLACRTCLAPEIESRHHYWGQEYRAPGIVRLDFAGAELPPPACILNVNVIRPDTRPCQREQLFGSQLSKDGDSQDRPIAISSGAQVQRTGGMHAQH